MTLPFPGSMCLQTSVCTVAPLTIVFLFHVSFHSSLSLSLGCVPIIADTRARPFSDSHSHPFLPCDLPSLIPHFSFVERNGDVDGSLASLSFSLSLLVWLIPSLTIYSTVGQ